MKIEAIFVTKITRTYTGKLYKLGRNQRGEIKWRSTGRYLSKGGSFILMDMQHATRIRFEKDAATVLEYVQEFGLPIIVRDISAYATEEDFLEGDL